MAEACRGSGWAPTGPGDVLDQIGEPTPAGGDHTILLSALTRVAVWELEVPGTGVQWHVPLSKLLGDLSGGRPFWVPSAAADSVGPMRAVAPDELGDVLLAPIVESARAGMSWDNYELVQEVVGPDGTGHQLMVRAVSVPGTHTSHTSRFFGIAAEVAGAERAPWMAADLAERLQLLVEHSPDGVIVHQDGVIVYANGAAVRIAGLDAASAGVGQHLTAFLHPDSIAPVIARLGQLRKPGDVVKGHEVIVLRPDGTEVPVEVASVRTTWGTKPAFQVIIHDLTERRRAERSAQCHQALEHRYAAAVAVLHEGVVLIDRYGGVCGANDSAMTILGARLAAGMGDAIFTGTGSAQGSDGSILPPELLPVASVLRTRTAVSRVVLGVDGPEGRQWLSVSARSLGDAHAGIGDAGDAVVVCSVSDITDRKELVDRLAWEARNDPLTGLANRTGLVTRLEGALAGLCRDLVLFAVDLDRFKLVNDSLGRAAGDEVLCVVAERLSVAAPQAQVVSRMYGGEFALLEGGIPDADAALQRAEELRAALAAPIRLSNGRTLTVMPSIGIVRLAEGSSDPGGLLQDADMALLRAKSRGRARVGLFEVALRDELGIRLELEDDLRQAIATGGLHLEYQPVVSLHSGRMLGLEALVRWRHPTRGLLFPGRFVALAEESDLIVELGSWVLAEGCRQMARWRAVHPAAEQAFLTVNVSPRQLDGEQLMPAVHRALRDSGLPPSALVLEITESGFVADEPANHAVLDDLRSTGVRLAIDDFGTGYSSLSYLKRLPVSYLKIDQSFVVGLGESEEDGRIVSAITELGHGLGLRIIAEGVERPEQLEAVASLGCDLYQGFLYARPEPPEAIARRWESA